MSDAFELITSEPAAKSVDRLLDAVRGWNAAGEISAISVAIVYTDGAVGNAHSKLHSKGLMLGAVRWLEHDLIKAFEA